MNRKVKYFLLLIGIILNVYAVSFFINPMLLGEMVGFSAHSPNTYVEITAFYGGLEFGLGLYFIWSALKAERYDSGLMTVFLLFFMAGLSRLCALLYYGFEDPSQPIVSVVEIVFSFLAIWFRRKIKTESNS